MGDTRFPAKPAEVVVLTAQEFAFELDMDDVPALDDVCRRFGDDTNRAVVWLLRFRALKTLCVRTDMTEWLGSRTHAWRAICEVAAAFELNDEWEFDKNGFCAAVDGVGRRRPGPARR